MDKIDDYLKNLWNVSDRICEIENIEEYKKSDPKMFDRYLLTVISYTNAIIRELPNITNEDTRQMKEIDAMAAVLEITEEQPKLADFGNEMYYRILKKLTSSDIKKQQENQMQPVSNINYDRLKSYISQAIENTRSNDSELVAESVAKLNEYKKLLNQYSFHDLGQDNFNAWINQINESLAYAKQKQAMFENINEKLSGFGL